MKDDEPETNGFESIDVADKVEIFATTDEKIKFLGELLSNESSRTILVLLTKKEMSANDIAEKIGLRLSLVIHHLNKMIQVSIVEVSRIGKSPKNHDVKYYSAKPGILILPEKASQKAKESKSFSKSLKSIMKFAAIGISAGITWMLTQDPQVEEQEPSTGLADSVEPGITALSITLSVIIIGLIIERVYSHYKK